MINKAWVHRTDTACRREGKKGKTQPWCQSKTMMLGTPRWFHEQRCLLSFLFSFTFYVFFSLSKGRQHLALNAKQNKKTRWGWKGRECMLTVYEQIKLSRMKPNTLNKVDGWFLFSVSFLSHFISPVILLSLCLLSISLYVSLSVCLQMHLPVWPISGPILSLVIAVIVGRRTVSFLEWI